MILQTTTIEIVEKLSRHYGDEIKYSIVGKDVSNIEKLIELLEDFEQIGASNHSRPENRN